MKNLILLAMIALTSIACKGPEGQKGMEMETCDVAKNEVREIITGEKRSCGIIRSSITNGEATEKLETRWVNETGNRIVAVRNGAFYTIELFEDGRIIAFRGKINLGEDTDNNTIDAQTVFDGLVMNGTLTFEDGVMVTTTESGADTYFPGQTLDITLTDEAITIVRTQEELMNL